MTLRFILTLVLLVLVPTSVDAAEPLTLDEVLRSLPRTHPQLEAADRGVDVAEGKALAARGGFDPELRIRSKWSPVGYYPNGQVDVLVRQPTPAWGIGLYAGYRQGFGNYPAYRGDLQTLSGGEVRAGIDVPLWRDGRIDVRRARIKQTKLRRRAAAQGRDATQLQLQRDAAQAYWTWVAAGQRLRIARELLAIAERRDAALLEQVDAGAVERIKLVDNRRLVLERMRKVVAAERDLETASVELSLYYRDGEREPVRPGLDRLPRALPEPELAMVDAGDVEARRAVRRRPEVAAAQAEREASKVAVDLAKNQRAPALNLQSFVARDFGAGPVELAPTEWGAGLTFALPIPLREARGNYRAAKAELAAVDAQLRGLRDRVGAEVRSAVVRLRAAAESVDLAREQVGAADELAAAERSRFREGASDLVIVNLRELAAADAAGSEVDALADYHRAHADFVVATGTSLLQ